MYPGFALLFAVPPHRRTSSVRNIVGVSLRGHPAPAGRRFEISLTFTQAAMGCPRRDTPYNAEIKFTSLQTYALSFPIIPDALQTPDSQEARYDID